MTNVFAQTMSNLDPSKPPSSNFDLKHWRLDTPLEGKNGKSKQLKPNELNKGYIADFFYTDNKDGSMVMVAPEGGFTTANSHYPRTELREEVSSGDWNPLVGTHSMIATLTVDRLANGAKSIIIGQVHGNNEKMNPQLVKIFWKPDGTITLQLKSDTNPSGDQMTYIMGKYKYGEKITYSVHMVDGVLTVVVTDGIRSATHISQFKSTYWGQQGFYFKAGVYMQLQGGSKSAGKHNSSVVKFHRLETAHQASQVHVQAQSGQNKGQCCTVL